MKIRQTCDRCGSEDVGVDAWAVWDVENQRWEIATTYDDAWCNACEAKTYIRTEGDDGPYANACDDADCACRRSPDFPDNVRDGCKADGGEE